MNTVCVPCAQGSHGACVSLDHEFAAECDCYAEDSNGHWALAHKAAAQAERERQALAEERARRDEDLRLQQMSYGVQATLLPEAEAATRAVDSLAEHHEDWLRRMAPVLREVCIRQPYVTTEDVWNEAARRGIPEPTDTRAMGTLMRTGKTERWMYVHRDDVRPRLWRSRIYRERV